MNYVNEKEKKLKLALTKLNNLNLINPDFQNDIIWIPEGTYDLACRGSDVSSMDYILYFSGIEFNVIP